jgi:UDP:flavonoid glycosyltransferase YjiC (YdhE family)
LANRIEGVSHRPEGSPGGQHVGVRVMATFVGGWGHAEPLIPLAELARRRGHHVTFVGQAGVVGRLGALGFDTELLGPDTLAITPQPLVPVDRAAERRVMRDHFVTGFGRYRAVRLGALFGRERPDVVVTTGPGVDPGALPRPAANVRVEAFRPQRELLADCSAVVCHAGSGTLSAALACGIPVVLLPLGADQPDNADRCVELGVGIELDPLVATPDDLAAATRAVIGDDRYRVAAGVVAAEAAMQPAIDALPELARLLGRPGS